MHTSVHTPSTELPLRGERLRLSSNTSRQERVSSLIVSAMLAIVLMAIVLIPRFADLDALVTPDEPIWIARSANFYVALADGDLKETYQFSHPGVTVMWLGAIGYRIVDPDLPDRINTHVETADVRDMVIPAGERPV
ncbi:MAG TPA: hypothetical protein VHR64_06715, partial [Thermomicrobiales bacterium]|nr:hypothetical protein [Thermomicrobiales bacterium]